MNGRGGALAVSWLVIAALGGLMLGCSSDNRAPSVAPAAVNGVAVIAAQSSNVPNYLEAIGTVRAAQSTQIASRTTGNIIEIRVQEGDRVRSGEILAVLDDSQPRTAVEQSAAAVTAAQKELSSAESELALANSTLQRYQQLYDKKSVSPQEFDEMKTRAQAAEARRDIARAGEAQTEAALTQSRTSLSYTQIHAPFDGVVIEKRAEAGALASPGMPLFTVEDTRRYQLNTTVDENDIGLVHAGEPVSVLLDSAGNAELRGKVAEIIPSADPASRSFLVKIGLPGDARVRSGLFGRARFARGTRPAIMIPRTAIVAHGQLQGVFAIDANQIAQLRYITLGNASGERVEVLSGLQSGEKLVAAPGDRDLGGKRIAPRP